MSPGKRHATNNNLTPSVSKAPAIMVPILPRCSCYPSGKQCQNLSDFWLFAPEGRRNPGGCVCREHGRAIVEEYSQKLGETWTLVPLKVP